MRNISKRKRRDRDLVYYLATTRYYAITMHFKQKVIVFSSSWRFLLNLSTDCTDEVSDENENKRVKAFFFQERRGRVL